jgi:agmatinase
MHASLESLTAGNPASPDAGIFGVTVLPEKSFLSIIPVSWDATASYGLGTERGPAAVLRASHQLDLEDIDFGKPYLHGISLLKPDIEIGILNQLTRKDAALVREDPNGDVDDLRAQINSNGDMINQKVYETAREILTKGRFCAVLGGDHSSPFGLIKALSEKYGQFGILHVDAHFDLRHAYEGFQWSHASIMGNCLRELPQVSKIVHVAIRDFSHEEKMFQQALGSRSDVYYSSDLFSRKARGEAFQSTVAEMLRTLPEHVYISFDIDGLDPSLCPSTGTPVPGGLQFEEAMFLVVELAKSGRKIIGFDLCEVAESTSGNEWDANVGARVLYKLCGALMHSQGRK